jgi:hypothetical protein
MRRWTEIGIAATEVDDLLAGRLARRGHAGEERREVLLRQTVESLRTGTHAR